LQYFNPSINIDSVRAQLATRGRVLVRDFFDAHVADALFEALNGIDWDLSYRDAKGDALLSGARLRSMDEGERAALSRTVHEIAAQRFQFSFMSHSLVQAALAGRTDLLARFIRWMADEEFMSRMRGMTGIDGLNRLYAQATMYVRGSFLRAHDDHVAIEDRKVAYVINLTRDWRADWGGLLHFCDERFDVVETFVPHFNSMSLFTVPQNHFVSYVAPFAQAQRCAITGWLIRA
jgi:Rps23 Pro-64 3,4-dihydroxylase Tpa1-like proline 4-hydroxylase